MLKDAVQKKASTICISRLSCPPASIKPGYVPFNGGLVYINLAFGVRRQTGDVSERAVCGWAASLQNAQCAIAGQHSGRRRVLIGRRATPCVQPKQAHMRAGGS